MDKALTSSKLHCLCPQDGFILEQLQGEFPAAYLLLHPFLQPRTLPLASFTPEHYPSRSQIVADCQPVSWQSVVAGLGLPDIAAIDIALGTLSLSLRQEFCRDDYAQQLVQYCEQQGLIPPDNGYLPDICYASWLDMLAGDNDHLWCGDEFGEDCLPITLDELSGDGDTLAPYPHARFFSADGEVMLCTHWDRYYSLLAGTPDRLQPFTRFEGFYCQPDTYVRWSRPSLHAGA
ncbi:DUF2711 family protein [Vogesella facilis]|uniref:DUF2711 family protein n=1 Tax=Vogesella facilis TaxID=1655232 RepID=A0ABV7RGR9_9NEIS